MTQYAVFHSEKSKASGGGLGNHIDRVEGKEHTYPHANPKEKHLNVNFEIGGYDKMKLHEAVAHRIKDGVQSKRKIRTDAVRQVKSVLTGSHERMNEIFRNEKLANEWARANYKFIAQEFGAENVVRFTLHLDEKTPHIHAVTVPITEDGRLSAKEVFGNKKEMQQRQDRYAEVMKPFGLERGIKNTGIKHDKAQDYYKRIGKAQKTDLSTTLEPVKNVFGISNSKKTIKKHEDTLKTLYLALQETNEKLMKEKIKSGKLDFVRKEEKKAWSIARSVNKEKEGVERNFKTYKRDMDQIILDPEKSQHLREVIQEKERERERGRKRGFGRSM